MAAVRHLRFLGIQIFNCRYGFQGKYIFRADRSSRCGDMAVFRFFNMAAMLDFQKLKILTTSTLRKNSVRHRAKFRADRSNRCQDMAVFPFLKMAAGGHPS